MSGARQVVSKHVGPIWVWSDAPGHFIETGSWWDQQLQPYIDQVADATAWAIDLGANIGWFSIYLAGLFQHVVSVEAHPQTFDLLLRNIAERALTNVHAINCAAYDRATTLRLAPTAFVGFPVTTDLGDCASASSVAFATPEALRGEGLLSIGARRIDDNIPPRAHVALIKCDVQGCDLRALMGLEDTIRRCRPRILWELEGGLVRLHDDHQEDYAAFFTRLDYSVTRIREDLWDYVSDPLERS
jgi:FkbM family methyltransferase